MCKMLCPLYNLNPSRYLHKTLCEYQSTLDNVQSTGSITLAFILFELFPFPDSMTMLGQRSILVSHSVGPTLKNNVAQH